MGAVSICCQSVWSKASMSLRGITVTVCLHRGRLHFMASSYGIMCSHMAFLESSLSFVPFDVYLLMVPYAPIDVFGSLVVRRDVSDGIRCMFFFLHLYRPLLSKCYTVCR